MEYERILFLDYSAVVLNNIDHLFSYIPEEKQSNAPPKAPQRILGASDDPPVQKIDHPEDQVPSHSTKILAGTQWKTDINARDCSELRSTIPSENMYLFSPHSGVLKAVKQELVSAIQSDPTNKSPSVFQLLKKTIPEVSVEILPEEYHSSWGNCWCFETSKMVYTRGNTYMEDPWSVSIRTTSSSSSSSQLSPLPPFSQRPENKRT